MEKNISLIFKNTRYRRLYDTSERLSDDRPLRKRYSHFNKGRSWWNNRRISFGAKREPHFNYSRDDLTSYFSWYIRREIDEMDMYYARYDWFYDYVNRSHEWNKK